MKLLLVKKTTEFWRQLAAEKKRNASGGNRWDHVRFLFFNLICAKLTSHFFIIPKGKKMHISLS